MLAMRTSSAKVKEYHYLRKHWSKCNVRTVWELGIAFGLSQIAKSHGITLQELRDRIHAGDDSLYQAMLEELLEVK